MPHPVIELVLRGAGQWQRGQQRLAAGLDMALNNTVPVGFAIGCTCQFGFLILGGAIASLASITDSRSIPFAAREVLFLSWGITQWIALIPLIMSQRASGNRKTAQGMLISGCLGVLLSSACAGMMIYTTGAGM
jgi:hypothetical protein